MANKNLGWNFFYFNLTHCFATISFEITNYFRHEQRTKTRLMFHFLYEI